MDNKYAFRDTTDLMVYGHEPWIEMGATHGHTGEEASLYMKWGHNMKTDGLARREGMAARVIHPDGKKEDVFIQDGSPEYYLLKFVPHTEGFYHVVTQNEGRYVIDARGKYCPGTRKDYPDAVKAVYYVQFAQAIVPAGHDLEGTPQSSGAPLEIRAELWKNWRAGDVLNLSLYNRGEPLDGIIVDLAVDGPSGYRQWQKMTGTGGTFSVQAEEPGRYIAIARHRVPGDGDNFDEISFTVTLAFMVTR